MIPAGDVVAGLLAGNAVVLKPSEVTPFIALKLKELFDASGMDPELFQLITGDGRTGAALVDAGIDKLVFTGAVRTGRKVAAACAERLMPCTVELGGKAAAIVCQDADLERTAQALVYGGFVNSGQVCISVERVYAHEKIHDALLDRVVALVSKLRQGDPASLDIDVGAIIFPPQVDVAQRLLADAKEKGASVLTGGKLREGEGLFFEPTVLSACSQDMAVMREEIFGPILPFMKVKDENEALDLANDSELGLAGYVFSQDPIKARDLAKRLRAGMVMVNDVLSGYGIAEAPFGGLKNSGIGRVHGEEGLLAMCEQRHLCFDRLTMKRDPFWFPYSEKTYRWLRKALNWLF
ncbi:MAG: aldehyde dehydrogenase family protein [Myxococcales bacterium]|nr:MAG: aldehyde dehydrogenase family protein [Myxococcales bacterium]